MSTKRLTEQKKMGTLEKTDAVISDSKNEMKKDKIITKIPVEPTRCSNCGNFQFYINKCKICGAYFCDDCYVSEKHECIKLKDRNTIKHEIERAIQIIKSETSPELIRKAMVDIGFPEYANYEQVTTILIDLLKSDNVMIKRNAIISLGKIKNPMTVHSIGLAMDEWDIIRYDIAYALSCINDEKGLVYLLDMVRNEKNSQRTQEEIERAINKLAKNNN